MLYHSEYYWVLDSPYIVVQYNTILHTIHTMIWKVKLRPDFELIKGGRAMAVFRELLEEK